VIPAKHKQRRLLATARTMSERQNTLLCCFEPTSPRLTAFDIHEWIHSQLKVSEHSVTMIQIDGIRRQVFIKFADLHFVHDIIYANNVYKHNTGENFPVRHMIAGMGTKRIRLANLPPELRIFNGHSKCIITVWRNPIITGRNMGKTLPLHCLQWSTDRHDDSQETHSLTHLNSWVQGTHFIRRITTNMLWMWRHRTYVPYLPKTQRGQEQNNCPV
jgi:hypothetical protein